MLFLSAPSWLLPTWSFLKRLWLLNLTLQSCQSFQQDSVIHKVEFMFIDEQLQFFSFETQVQPSKECLDHWYFDINAKYHHFALNRYTFSLPYILFYCQCSDLLTILVNLSLPEFPSLFYWRGSHTIYSVSAQDRRQPLFHYTISVHFCLLSSLAFGFDQIFWKTF